MWRNKLNSRMGTVVALVAMFVCSAVAVAGKPGGGGGTTTNYNLVRLAYPGAISTEALQLNDSANVAGTYRDADNVPYGFHYDLASGVYTPLGFMTSARGINQQDAIVGHTLVTYINGGGEELLIPGRGLYWSPPTYVDPIVLLPLEGHTHSKAVAVNDARIIIGESYIPEDNPDTPGYRAVVAWYIDTEDNVVGPVELPFLAVDIDGHASDLTEEVIDGAGINVTTVVGTSGNHLSGEDDWPQPVSWTVTRADSGLEVTLEVTGPVEFGGSYFLGEARGVNKDGDAVGRAAFGEGLAGEPFLRGFDDQSMIRLPMLSKAVSGTATSINDAGQIVGQQNVYQRGQGMLGRAVLWTNSTTVVDLNSQVKLGSGETLDWAADINHRLPRGDILARIHQGSTVCLLIAK